MDEMDREIVLWLQEDGRMPYTRIAAELGVSEGTIRQRVKRMVDEGTLQIVAVVEPHYLGWGAVSLIGVTVQAGRVDGVAQEITALPEVNYLFMASGEFDLFVEAYCRDQEHFVEFLSQKLQQIPGVTHTKTFMIMRTYKPTHRWGKVEPPAPA